jgi:disulfide oxidoreductase YuzD
MKRLIPKTAESPCILQTNEAIPSVQPVQSSNKPTKTDKLSKTNQTVASDRLIKNTGSSKETKKKIDSISDSKPQQRKQTYIEPLVVNGIVNHPVSDDTMDYLEAQVDRFNESKNLGEKINIHSKLKEYVSNIDREIDQMYELIDKYDTDAIGEEIMAENDASMINNDIDVENDIANLESMVDKLKEEEIMQKKMVHLQSILEKINRYRSKCDSSKMRIAKCN